MTSYLRKYVTALASAKDYVAQWSSEHVYANEVLIVPFPTLAIFDPEKQTWTVQIKAWLYLPFEGKKLKSYLPALPSLFAGKPAENQAVVVHATEETKRDESPEEKSDDNEDDDIYEDALQEEFGEITENPGRLGLFFVGNSVKVVTKSIINGVEHLLQPSDESGFIEEQLELNDQDIATLAKPIYQQCEDRKFDYDIQLNESKVEEKGDQCRSFKCTIYVLAAHGVSVISDIDDTIKISKVLSKRALLKHTFYSYFKPVEGMSELYRRWSEEKCQFHYVSASPWQLYPALRCFLEKHQYPLGTMNLRKFSWSLAFFKPADTYKIETITPIIVAYPARKYICVGDSGELDPEIYSKLYSLYPENISHIFIRDICSTPECSPVCQERYRKIFEEVPKSRWTVFKDPKDIETNIEKLIHG